jgi:hypothetical protein
LLLECFCHSLDDSPEHRWFRFAPHLKEEGWSAAVLRDFERIARPHLTSSRPSFARPCPPPSDWGELRLGDVVSFQVHFQKLELDVASIPGQDLPTVLRILRRGLEHASGLLADVDTAFWHTASFHPESKPGDVYFADVDRYLSLVVRLFDRLASESPDVARLEVSRWPLQEEFFFDKLRIYAGMRREVLTGEDVVSWLVSLPDARFWNVHHRRELLHTLRARWGDLSSDARAQIESRIIAGPARWRDEEDAQYHARKASTAATVLGWLESHGCQLSADARAILLELRAADPRWQPAWDEAADESFDARGGAVRTESDPSGIVEAPVGKLLDVADQHSKSRIGDFTDRDPFRGVVEQRPRRALAALSYAARQDQFPQRFWQTLLSHWPDDVPQRLRWTLANRLVRLPTSVVSELRYYVPNWFRKNLPHLAQSALARALDLWDRMFAHFLTAGPSATVSSLGDTFIQGKALRRSHRTFEAAIRSPVGQLTDLLLDILRRLDLRVGARIPAEIKIRLERASSAPGEGRGHAISELAAHVTWLHQLDPNWVEQEIIPFFDPTHTDSEPAWNGYAFDRNDAGPGLFALLKPHFLKVFRVLLQWPGDEGVEQLFCRTPHPILLVASR